MQGQVLEIDCSAPELAMSILRKADLFSEVSLYGAQIHVVADDVASYEPQIEEFWKKRALRCSPCR